MDVHIDLDEAFHISSSVAARSIDGRVVIVPVGAGVGRPGDELFVLNDTGEAVWAKLDGRRSLRTIVTELAEEYHADHDVVAGDVVRLVTDLLELGILVDSGEQDAGRT